MTNLELLICEAENNGEISIDIRDELLEVLNESTALQRNAIKIDDEIYKLQKEKSDVCKKYKNLLNSATSDKEEDRIKKLIEQKTKEYDDKIDKLHDRAEKYSIHNNEGKNITSAAHSKYTGNLAARAKRRSETSKDLFKAFYDPSGNIKKGKESKDRIRETFYSKGKDPNNKKPGRYLDAMKESVDELKISIYEAELSGVITAEERSLLLLELEDYA